MLNYYGTYSLAKKEIRRFLKVYHQTIIAPAISSMIFLCVFMLASSDPDQIIGGVKFINFLGYGLIIMTIVQNSFSNSLSSLIMSKVIGYINDILMPPFSGVEIIIAYICGSILRGITCGLAITLCLIPFVDFNITHPGLLVFFTISSSALMGQVGILSGIACNTFDESAAITSYIITPLSFLSGTFYSVEKLPLILQHINICNPFFYIIDGFRYSFTNHSDGNVQVGIILISTLNILIFYVLCKLFEKGWKLRS